MTTVTSDPPTHRFEGDGHGYCTVCELPLGNRRHKVQATRPADAPERTHSPHGGALPNTGTLKAQVLSVVKRRAEGATDDEIEQIMGRTHQSVSAARRGLVKDGHLRPHRDSQGRDVVRLTRSGHNATVWVPTSIPAVGMAS